MTFGRSGTLGVGLAAGIFASVAIVVAVSRDRSIPRPAGNPVSAGSTRNKAPTVFEIVRPRDEFHRREIPVDDAQASAPDEPAIYFLQSKESDG